MKDLGTPPQERPTSLRELVERFLSEQDEFKNMRNPPTIDEEKFQKVGLTVTLEGFDQITLNEIAQRGRAYGLSIQAALKTLNFREHKPIISSE